MTSKTSHNLSDMRRPSSSQPALSRIMTRAAYTLHAFQARSLRHKQSDRIPGRPLVVGYLGASIGLGQAARLFHSAFTDIGSAPAFIDLSPDFANDADLSPHVLHADDARGPLVLIVNPPEVPKALKILRARGIKVSDRYRILACVWEQPRAPEAWGPVCDMFNEIWVPSRFNVKALEHVTQKPVRHVPYPFRPLSATQMPVKPRPLRQGAFNVLSTFDLQSGWVRKNPLGAIEAFHKAFDDRTDVHLILKGRNLKLPAQAELQAAVDRHDNISFYDEELEDLPMLDLIFACDAVLSLGRAEGFGLVAAQALALGCPAIVTGGTGAEEYSDNPGVFSVRYDLQAPPKSVRHYHHSLGQWTEPDLDDAAQKLRRVREMSTDQRAQLSIAARAHWESRFNIDAIWSTLPNETRHLFAPNVNMPAS